MDTTSNRRGLITRIKLENFDASAYLDNEEVIAEFLTAALEDGDPEVFRSAIGRVAKARAMSAIAENTDAAAKAVGPQCRSESQPHKT